MDATTLQAKVYSGYGKAALRIGKPSQVFHPIDPLAPLFQSQVSVDAAFTQDMQFSKPNKYGQATWWCLADAAHFSAGDYLQNEDGIWFIAAKQHLLPILAVGCNRTISVKRVTQDGSFGAKGYGGTTPEKEIPIMQGWPASVLQGTKGEKNPAALPQDERIPWWSILLPHFKDFATEIIIKVSDIITDDLGRRYVVSSPELTDLGWRITASLQGA